MPPDRLRESAVRLADEAVRHDHHVDAVELQHHRVDHNVLEWGVGDAHQQPAPFRLRAGVVRHAPMQGHLSSVLDAERFGMRGSQVTYHISEFDHVVEE